MKKVLWTVFGVLVAYLGAGVLLHHVVLPMDPVPADVVLQVGDRLISERQGEEQYVLGRRGDTMYMESRLHSGAAGPLEHVHLSIEET